MYFLSYHFVGQPKFLDALRNNSLHIYFAAIQAELLKVKQKIKAQKDKEKAAYAKMFA